MLHLATVLLSRGFGHPPGSYIGDQCSNLTATFPDAVNDVCSNGNSLCASSTIPTPPHAKAVYCDSTGASTAHIYTDLREENTHGNPTNRPGPEYCGVWQGADTKQILYIDKYNNGITDDADCHAVYNSANEINALTMINSGYMLKDGNGNYSIIGGGLQDYYRVCESDCRSTTTTSSTTTKSTLTTSTSTSSMTTRTHTTSSMTISSTSTSSLTISSTSTSTSTLSTTESRTSTTTTTNTPYPLRSTSRSDETAYAAVGGSVVLLIALGTCFVCVKKHHKEDSNARFDYTVYTNC